MGFFSESVESINEMAAPKMPEGMKRKRHDTYAHTHNISIDGKHVAIIAGHKPGWGNRGFAPHQKIYHVYKNDEDMKNSWQGKDSGHPDHSHMEDRLSGQIDGTHTIKKVRRPIVYHSMEDAVNAVHHNHANAKEFGKGHDPKVRWQKAIDHAHEAHEHERKTGLYNSAITHARSLGHEDIASQLEHHKDAHVANKSSVTRETLHRWTHDAHKYTGTHYKDGGYHPTHPEHHELANHALKAVRGY
jgi:hypothetical protein